MRPGRKNGIKPDGWKIELELGNKQDLLEIGLQKKSMAGGDHGNQYKKVAGLSKNDKPGNPPHNTREIIAGNDIEAQKLALDFCTDPLGYRLSTASPEELRQTPERRRLIEYLREHGGHGRTSEIAAALGIDDSTASRLLRRLADDGLIVRTQYGEYALLKNGMQSVQSAQS